MARIKKVDGDATTEAADLLAEIETKEKRWRELVKEENTASLNLKTIREEKKETEANLHHLAGARDEQPLLNQEED